MLLPSQGKVARDLSAVAFGEGGSETEGLISALTTVEIASTNKYDVDNHLLLRQGYGGQEPATPP
ncbi:MAG: hypothetical protein ACSHYA_09955 [Opitutaceae bacterium]